MNYTKRSEIQEITKLLITNKDEQTFNIFYNKLYYLIYTYFKNKYKNINIDDLNDSITDAFVYFYKNMSKYDTDYFILTYLCSIVKNNISNLYRKNNHNILYTNQLETIYLTIINDSIAEDTSYYHVLLKNNIENNIFLLKYKYMYTTTEICSILNIKRWKVKKIINIIKTNYKNVHF